MVNMNDLEVVGIGLNGMRLTKVSSCEGYGSEGSEGWVLYLQINERMISKEETWIARRAMEAMVEAIKMHRVKLALTDPTHEKSILKKAWTDKIQALFVEAGLDPISTRQIENGYCKLSCCFHNPWLEVLTRNRGIITIGWRKSVMNIDWSQSEISTSGETLFRDEAVTKGFDYVHAWGYEKAGEYLKKLAGAA